MMKQEKIGKVIGDRQRAARLTIWQITMGSFSIRCVQIDGGYRVQGRGPAGWIAHELGTGTDPHALWARCIDSRPIWKAIELQIAVARQTR